MKYKDFYSQLFKLNEGREHNLALEYIANLIKTGPFRGRVYLAGGAVRDMEMGKDPKDLDVVVKGGLDSGIEFATWATKAIGNYKEGSNPVTFPRFGTAKFTLTGVVYKGEDLSGIDIEAVATRKEKYSDGSRKPEVSAGDLSDDVYRRDFTINSLLQDLTTGEILDLTGKGREDIKAGIVRTPLNPDVIFAEDPLRLLRAIRFAIKYEWKLPLDMLKAMKRNAGKLDNISAERIR
jgi:poly(A) polymerase